MSDDNNSHVTAIQKYSKGFFVASDRGEVALWVRSDENNNSDGNNFYDWIRTWQPQACMNQRVLGLALDKDEDTLGLCLNNNNIGIVSIKSIGLNNEGE